MVAVAEAHLVGQVVDRDAVGGVVVAQVGFTPGVEDGRIKAEGQDEVEEHAAEHDEKPLPSLLGAEFPRLWLGGQVSGLGGFVHHARDGAVTAEGNPADAEFRGLGMLFPRLGAIVAGEEAPVQFAVEALDLHQGKFRIEKEIESLHPHFEESGKEEVSKFVHRHQQGERKNDLNDFQ